MYVSAIDMWYNQTGRNYTIYAKVTIHDTAGNPVEGATVEGAWSGAYSGCVSGATGASGTTVSFATPNIEVSDLTFIFTVNDVIKDGYEYDPSFNMETSDTSTCPDPRASWQYSTAGISERGAQRETADWRVVQSNSGARLP